MQLKLNIFLWSLLLNLLPIDSPAESCEAESMFNKFYAQSKNNLSEQKCINISISEIYEPEDHNMVYRWNMGDGKQETGLDVTHCYAEYGTYTATLDAILPETDFISKDEMSLDIVIKEPVSLSLAGPDKSEIEENTSFSFNLSPLLTYELDQVYWQVGDSVFYCGFENLSHQFTIPGEYTVKLLVRLKNLDGNFYIADHKTIVVKGNNVFGQQLTAFFENDENPNPFLADQVHLAIINKSNEKSYEYSLQSDDSLCLLLPSGKNYEMYLWQGNQYLSPIAFSTTGSKDSLATFNIIRSVFKDVLAGELHSILPIAFETNSKSLDRKVKKLLKQNAKKIKQLEGFTFTIGSFTHTGGALHINLEFSDARSLAVKEYLQKKLKDKIQLKIADPREETCLINTSYKSQGIQEEERFNGKTYLKIAGIEKAL